MASLVQSMLFIGMAVLSAMPRVSSSTASTYIVHMDLSAMPLAFSGHRSWYQATLAAVDADDVSTILYIYEHALQGFSAPLTVDQLNKLKKSRGYVSSYRDMPVEKDTTHTPEFLGLSRVSGLWPAANLGEDVIIGVVDTGIWPESESFDDRGMTPVPSRWKGTCEEGTAFTKSSCNRKLIGARGFNKGLRASDPNMTISVNSPRDTDGHGTHTASTAAGSDVPGSSFFGYAPGSARGVAPQARLAAYKVLWDEGGYMSDIVAGIDQAIVDGVDVLSISLGVGGLPLYADPVAIASYAAVTKGVVVSTSSGNAGPDFRFVHNDVPWVLTVGAGTVDRKFAGVVQLGDGSSFVGKSLYPGDKTFLRKRPLVDMGSCENETLLHLVGRKIVVACQSSTLDEVVDRVASAKVGAALFISDDPFADRFVHFTFPAAIFSPQDGRSILNYINVSSNPVASLTFRETFLGTKTAPAPQVAIYSSRGPSRSCPYVLKPDIIAPGTLILASWARNSSVGLVGSREIHSSYSIISGSSMSCPHASGVAALLKRVYPSWSPAAIRSAMMTTASRVDKTGNPIADGGDEGRPATPLAMGSGHIDPNKALDPGLVYDATEDDYVGLLCGMNYTKEQIQIITKTTPNCSNPSLDLNYPSFISFFQANETPSSKEVMMTREFERIVTNVGDATATYTPKIIPPKGLQIKVEPEKLVFKNKYEKQRYKLTLEGRLKKKGNRDVVAHGWLSWVDEMEKHVVTSPIVATTMSLSPP